MQDKKNNHKEQKYVEFQEIYERESGEKISYEEAKIQGERLLELTRVLVRRKAERERAEGEIKHE